MGRELAESSLMRARKEAESRQEQLIQDADKRAAKCEVEAKEREMYWSKQMEQTVQDMKKQKATESMRADAAEARSIAQEEKIEALKEEIERLKAVKPPPLPSRKGARWNNPGKQQWTFFKCTVHYYTV